MFVICELGERLIIAYDEMGCEIERFNWYLFSIEIQRILPIVMIGAQESVRVRCFGSISTNRVAFKQVRYTKK